MFKSKQRNTTWYAPADKLNVQSLFAGQCCNYRYPTTNRSPAKSTSSGMTTPGSTGTSISRNVHRNVIQIRTKGVPGLPTTVMRRTGTPRRSGTGRQGTGRVTFTVLGMVCALFRAVLAAAPTAAATVAAAALAVGVAWRRLTTRRSGRRCLPDEAGAGAWIATRSTQPLPWARTPRRRVRSGRGLQTRRRRWC